jgi:hypothetical protein
MADQSRLFQAGPDPFGRMWRAQFRWLQNAITIRHADTIDVKFLVTPDGSESEEKVIAIPHAALLDFCNSRKLRLTDGLCMHIGASHLRHMIETLEDVDKTLITLKPEELAAAYDGQTRGVTVR